MADPSPNPDAADDTGVRPDRGPTGMPRWVKVFLVIAILLVLALLISSLVGVQHGPRQHTAPEAAVAMPLR
jgi:hypothetical protein